MGLGMRVVRPPSLSRIGHARCALSRAHWGTRAVLPLSHMQLGGPTYMLFRAGVAAGGGGTGAQQHAGRHNSMRERSDAPVRSDV
jgi:hypothetical protein